MKYLAIALAGVVAISPITASADQPVLLDKIEDRIDLREGIADRAVDHGPLDRLEDRRDLRESIRDRRGIEGPRIASRRERRDIRRQIWINNR